MTERKSTGGTKEFSYTTEDMDRIRKTDTGSTKEFKEAYRKWESERVRARAEMQRLQQERKRLIRILTAIVALLCLIAVAVLLVSRWAA